MIVVHKLGPTTRVPTGMPGYLCNMLLDCEDPRGRWGFVEGRTPEESRVFYIRGTAPDGSFVDVDFVNPSQFTCTGRWEPLTIPVDDDILSDGIDLLDHFPS